MLPNPIVAVRFQNNQRESIKGLRKQKHVRTLILILTINHNFSVQLNSQDVIFKNPTAATVQLQKHFNKIKNYREDA